MKLRDILIGGAITLVVTFAATVAAWYYTQWQEKRNAESLVFEKSYTQAFTSETSNIGTATVSISNIGDETEENVVANVQFTQFTRINDTNSQSNSGELLEYKLTKIDDSKISVSIKSLNPSEKLTISFLVSGSSDFDPAVELRSSRSTGAQVINDSFGNISIGDFWRFILILTLIILSILTILYVTF